MASEPPLPRHFGRYQVVEELGRGAMGVVYLAVDPRLARPVAVKVLKEADRLSEAAREEYQARFRREAEAAGKMSHPDLVQIYDVGPSYLVMEYLEGQPLSVVLGTGVTLTVRQASSLILRVADALEYAHGHGIVHRDIKPGNVMLLNDGGVKVMDFGVARVESSTLTAAGTVVGSVRYMAPEQMMGEAVDSRADVFSLAAMAYEMLTGRPPFPGKTITEIVANVVGGTYVPLRRANSQLPEPLDAVFARGLAATVGERYPRAMDFARDLYEAAQPVLDLDVRHEAEEPMPGPGGTTVVAPARSAASHPAETLLMASPPLGREGLVLLDSDPPGARVYLDGAPVGQAPLHGIEVPFGRHVVRMEAEGRKAVSAEVEVKRERPLRAVTVSLPEPHAEDGSVRPGQLVELGPEVTPPRRIEGRAPVYPEAARERGMEGSPVVELWINERGDVADVAIVESAGATLDDALLHAVTGWRFTPASLRGVPVSVRMTVQHLFRR